MTTGEWFRSLDASDRKQLLCLLHDIRHAQRGVPRAAHLAALIGRLEDEHEAAKGNPVTDPRDARSGHAMLLDLHEGRARIVK